MLAMIGCSTRISPMLAGIPVIIDNAFFISFTSLCCYLYIGIPMDFENIERLPMVRRRSYEHDPHPVYFSKNRGPCRAHP